MTTLTEYSEAAEWLDLMITGHMVGVSRSANEAWTAELEKRIAIYVMLRDLCRSLAEGKVLVPRQCDDIMYAAAMDCYDDDGNMREIVEAAIAAATQGET